MPAYKFGPTASRLMDPQQESVFDPLHETLIRRATSIFGGDDPISSVAPVPLLAGVKPAHIPALKQWGKALLEDVKRGGVSKVEGGIPSTTKTPLNPDTIRGLELAQKRYPRLFGHILEITDVPEDTKRAFPKQIVRGQMSPARSRKFSNLALSPEFAAGKTVGHELLHAADNLVDPEMVNKYSFFNRLPGGYNANSMEIRARNMEDIFNERLKQANPSFMDYIKTLLPGK
jgi:hypothetical protein